MRGGLTRLCALAAALCLGLAAAPAAIAETLSYTSAMGAEVPPDAPMPAGFTAEPIRRGPGLSQHQAGRFTAREWTVNGNRAQAEADGSWLEWQVSAAHPFDLGPLTLGVARHPNGPRSLQLELRVDGGDWQVLHVEPDLPQNLTTPIMVDLSHVTGIASAEFRLYGWNARRWNGWLSLENLPQAGGKTLVIGVTPDAVAFLEAQKVVRVHSQNGWGCTDAGSAAGAGAQAAIPGACVEYRIDLVNTGNGEARNVRLTDVLAPNHRFAAAWHQGFDTSAPGFAFEVPAPLTGCGGGACMIELREGVIAGGAQARVVIRALLD